MHFWNLNLLSGTLGIPSGGGGCATHKPPHQKARRKSASKRKRVVTASIKACGPRGPSQEGWHDKQAIANKPMGLKWGLLAPTPERGRICMPRKTIDKQTKKPISDKTIHRVFKTFCYDEQEGDCWQYRNAPQQDCFTERDYPARVKTAQHVLHNVTRAAAWNFIALQPPAIPPLSATCEVQKPACEKCPRGVRKPSAAGPQTS